MSYTFEHVLDECVAEKASNTAPEAKRSMYEEAFQALNVWIESRLSKRKGAEIGSFGTFTWEMKTTEDGEDQMRPIFLIADSFVKDHRVKQQRIHYYPKTATNEEINHSKLAIKFTVNLTKDMVFCSLRDVIRKIGDFVARGYEFTVPFSFGTFMAKERRVKFEFSFSRFANILPAGVMSSNNATDSEELIPSSNHETDSNGSTNTMNAASITASGNLLDVLDKTLERSTASAAEKKTPTVELSIPPSSSSCNNVSADNIGIDDATAFLDEFEDEMGSPETNPSAPSSTQNRPADVPKLELTGSSAVPDLREDVYSEHGTKNFGLREPPSPRMLELLIPKQPRTDMDRKIHTINARQSVVDEAYNRMLTEIERDTLNDEYTKRKMAESEHSHEQTEVLKRQEQEKLKFELQKVLDKQVVEFEERRHREREDSKNAKITSIIEENADKKMIKVDKGELCDMLLTQMSSKEQSKRDEKERKLQEEREYLDHVAIELDMQNAAVQADHLSKQSVLLEAWEREGHVRNLKKLQNSGINAVHGYIRTNLMDGTPDVMAKSYSARSLTSGRVGMSVGYDTRKGGKS